jgi:tRNA-Thr(GGU) m(6)t(6)A37 methyltransferase TsaA
LKIEVEPIGWVRTTRQEATDDYWGGVISAIELDTSRFKVDAVAGLDQFSHIEVIFCLDKVPLDKIVLGAGHPRENPSWPKVGVFAQRKKNRPNRLGLTTCRLLKVDGTTLTVTGLDAIDGTPVLDIKPCVREFLIDRAEVKQPPWIGELMKDYFAAGKKA